MPLFLFLLILLSIPSCSQPPKKLDASYDIGKDLILLQTTADAWYDRKDLTEEQRWEEYESVPGGYHAIYWNPKNNTYYYAHGDGQTLYITNGLSYKIDPAKQETNYTLEETEYIDYAGSISLLERLYIDKKDGTQYIKRLRVIKDPFPVYPIPPSNLVSRVELLIYTNKEGQKFYRSLNAYYGSDNEHIIILNPL